MGCSDKLVWRQRGMDRKFLVAYAEILCKMD